MINLAAGILHSGTLIAVNALVAWLTGTAFLLAAIIRPKLVPRNSLFLWFGAYYAFGFGFSVLMLPAFQRNIPWLGLIGNLLIDLGTALNFVAVVVYLKCSRRYLLYLLPAGLIGLIETVYVVSQFQNMRIMVLLGCTLRGILTVAAGSALWACADDIRRPIARVIAGFHYLWALVLLSRMLWWLFNPNAGADYDPTSPFGLTARLLLTCAIMPCFLWMLTRQLDAQLLHHASRDALTGAFNRRVLWERGEARALEARRSGGSIAVIMIDVDHFKKINDGWGHSVGDQVLTAIAATLTGTVRAQDVVARVGGEEFMVLLGHAPAAADAAERIRAAISMLSIPLENGERLGCTVSVGHAQASGKAAQWRNLVADADGALYRAKNSGRNTVVDAALCQPEPVTTQTA